MGIYMCMKSGCRVSGEDFAHSIIYYKGVSFYSNHFVTFIYTTAHPGSQRDIYKEI